MLTIEDILQACSRSVFLRGHELVNNVSTSLFHVNDTTGKNGPEHTISAMVKSSSGTGKYMTRLNLSDAEGITDYACTCPYFRENDLMCKHLVAVAFVYRAKQMAINPKKSIVRQPHLQTTRDLSDVMSQYALHTQPAQTEDEPVHVEASFSIYHGEASLSCRVGRSRLLIVKNILHFIRSYELGRFDQYGTKLGFYHTPDAFDEESRELMAALTRSAADTIPDYASPSYDLATEFRNLNLYGSALARLLRVFLGRTVVLDEQEVPVVDGDPEVTFTVTRCPGGASLEAPALTLCAGDDRCFALCGGKLWYCSEAFTARVMPLWRLFLMRDFWDTQRSLALSEQDISRFCATTVPALSGLAAVKWVDLRPEEWLPPTPVFSVYLRQEDEDTVTAFATAAYGEQVIDLMDPATLRTGWHDPKETRLRRLLTRYFPNAIPNYVPPFDAAAYGEADGDDAPVRVETRSRMLRSASGSDALWTLLDTGIRELSELAEVYADDRFRRLRVAPPPAVQVGVSVSSGLLDLRVNMEGLDITEINAVLDSYRARRKYHRLKDGQFLQLGEGSLAAVTELAEGLHLTGDAFGPEGVRLSAANALYVDQVLDTAPDVRLNRSRDFRQFIRELRDFHNGEAVVPESLNAELRPYQADGFQWLCALYHLGLGGILADDMGLGKTLQMLAMLLHAAEAEEHFTALIVAPTSLLYNWQHEAERFTPTLSVQLIAGTASERAGLIAHCPEHHLNITSYDLFKRDAASYADMSFSCLVLDEAQFIKNAATKAARSIQSVHAVHRFAMTGTPVENRLSDLWSIFQCVMPGYLYAYQTFRRELEQPIAREDDPVARERLARMVGPFLLRRKKADVLRELPDKLEENCYISMTDEQTRLYNAARDQLMYELTNSDEDEVRRNKLRILAALTRLRQLCCSPALCFEDYAAGSGKTDACLELLHSAVAAGHRVLVFSQFTSMLELLIAQWDERYLYLSGKDSKQARQAMVEQFQQGDVPVFFISLKAGGTGLNLTQADTVIHCDPWWNVAAQDQATDRAHRIGQKNVVHVMRLIARDTIEEKIVALQERKSALADAVVASDRAAEFTLDREELLALFSER